MNSAFISCFFVDGWRTFLRATFIKRLQNFHFRKEKQHTHLPPPVAIQFFVVVFFFFFGFILCKTVRARAPIRLNVNVNQTHHDDFIDVRLG